MRPTIDALLVIGLFANMLKLADLLLRKHQRKVLEDGIETLILQLDYARPLAWFRSLAVPANWRIVRLCFVALIALVVLEAVAEAQLWQISRIAAVILIGFVPLASMLPFWRRGGRYCAWLLEDIHFPLVHRPGCGGGIVAMGSLFGVRYSTLTVCIVILMAAFLEGMSVGGILTTVLSSLGFVVILIPALALFAFGSAVQIAMLFCVTAAVVLTLFRAIAWRIVEYSKGPLAAVILLVTMSLGALRVALYFLH